MPDDITPIKPYIEALRARLAQHDGCSRYGTKDMFLLSKDLGAYPLIVAALAKAKAALVGNSNDVEHEALMNLMESLGYEKPDCDCEDGRHGHQDSCPCSEWEAK